MITLALLAGLVVMIIAGAAARENSHPVESIRWPAKAPEEVPPDQLDELIAYGTATDAQRLMDQGIDLTALGYRPPQE